MSMGMRTWTVAALLGAMLMAIGSPAAAEITWKASIWGPQRPTTQPFEWFAKEVAAKTGGQLKITFTYGQAGPTESFDLLKSGSSDAAYFCASSYTDKLALATVLELPMFAPDSTSALGRVQLALGDHPAMQAELKKWNVKALVPTPLPQYQLMGTRRIAKVDDFQGAKVRISPAMGKILEEYGASINAVPVTETLAAMRSGAIDVAALPYPYGFGQFKVHEGSKYVTEKISLGAPFCFFGVSQKAWDSLPVKLQEVVLSLREPALAQYEGLYERENAEHISAFKQKGLEFVAFSPADRARLVAKAIKYWQAWVDEREKQGLKGREIFEFAQAKIKEFTRK